MGDSNHYINGMSIMRINWLLNFTHDQTRHLNTESMKLFNEIFGLFRQIKPIGYNNYRQVWFKIPRGSYTDYKFASEADACEYFEVDDPNQLQEAFEEHYPNEDYWLSVESFEEPEYQMIRIGKFNIVIVTDDHDKEIDSIAYNFSALLQWVKQGIEDTLEECKTGNYNARIDRELPYTLRYGVIQRKQYWDQHPDCRKYVLKDLTQQEIDGFVELLKAPEVNTIPSGRIQNMTFNQYFEYAAKAFEAAGLMEKRDGTPYEYFRKYGEDFGGRILETIDLDSPDDFYRYYKEEWRAGGHPWGLMRGSSRSRIMLVPRLDDNGYYFTFSGDPNWSAYEIVKMFPALYHAGLPVYFYDAELAIMYFLEEDLIGFVSEKELTVYCQNKFEEDTPVNDFYHLDIEKDDAIKDLIDWYPLHQTVLEDI